MQARINLLIQSSGARCLIILIAAAALMGGSRGAVASFEPGSLLLGSQLPQVPLARARRTGREKKTVPLPYGLVIVKRHFAARRLLAFSNHVCNSVGERETRPKYDLAAPRVRAGVLLKFQPGTSFAA
jgi:hypothetical protein